MSAISRKTIRNFSIEIRKKGHLYFGKGDINILKSSYKKVEATFSPDSLILMTLTWIDFKGEEVILAKCTCCTNFGPESCSHIWGVLLCLKDDNPFVEEASEENEIEVRKYQALKKDKWKNAKILENVVEKSPADFLADDERSLYRELVKLRDLIEKMAVGTVDVIETIKMGEVELRPYQRKGVEWLKMMRKLGLNGFLADDMGLGKTVQVLMALSEFGKEDYPHLILAPKSLVYNWEEEIQRFTPHQKVLMCLGGFDKRQEHYKNLKQYVIILMSYGILRQDFEILKKMIFHTIIIDEAQIIKNSDSQTAMAVYCLQSRYKLALSGTPIENHPGELFSIFKFLGDHLVREEFLDCNYHILNQEKSKIFIEAFKPLILRRTKQEVLSELPAKTEGIIYCEMTPRQERLYQDVREAFSADLSSPSVLEKLLRLRQIACHPDLFNNHSHNDSRTDSGKTLALFKVLNTVIENGHKVLIFSQFTSFLKIVQEMLMKKEIGFSYLDGQTRDRPGAINKFKQNPNCLIFLISLKAGGTGLNLTEASYSFLLDPWWNPAVENQAIDRIYRIGQNNPVFAYRLITKNTVEEKLLIIKQKKQKLIVDAFDSEKGFFSSLTSEDIEFILS